MRDRRFAAVHVEDGDLERVVARSGDEGLLEAEHLSAGGIEGIERAVAAEFLAELLHDRARAVDDLGEQVGVDGEEAGAGVLLDLKLADWRLNYHLLRETAGQIAEIYDARGKTKLRRGLRLLEQAEQRHFEGAQPGRIAGRKREVAGTSADRDVFAQGLDGDRAEAAVVVADWRGVAGGVVGGEIVDQEADGLVHVDFRRYVETSRGLSQTTDGRGGGMEVVHLQRAHGLVHLRGHAGRDDGGAVVGLCSRRSDGIEMVGGHHRAHGGGDREVFVGVHADGAHVDGVEADAGTVGFAGGSLDHLGGAGVCVETRSEIDHHLSAGISSLGLRDRHQGGELQRCLLVSDNLLRGSERGVGHARGFAIGGAYGDWRLRRSSCAGQGCLGDQGLFRCCGLRGKVGGRALGGEGYGVLDERAVAGVLLE